LSELKNLFSKTAEIQVAEMVDPDDVVVAKIAKEFACADTK
jgi:hypothetical protein